MSLHHGVSRARLPTVCCASRRGLAIFGDRCSFRAKPVWAICIAVFVSLVLVCWSLCMRQRIKPRRGSAPEVQGAPFPACFCNCFLLEAAAWMEPCGYPYIAQPVVSVAASIVKHSRSFGNIACMWQVALCLVCGLWYDSADTRPSVADPLDLTIGCTRCI